MHATVLAARLFDRPKGWRILWHARSPVLSAEGQSRRDQFTHLAEFPDQHVLAPACRIRLPGDVRRGRAEGLSLAARRMAPGLPAA